MEATAVHCRSLQGTAEPGCHFLGGVRAQVDLATGDLLPAQAGHTAAMLPQSLPPTPWPQGSCVTHLYGILVAAQILDMGYMARWLEHFEALGDVVCGCGSECVSVCVWSGKAAATGKMPADITAVNLLRSTAVTQHYKDSSCMWQTQGQQQQCSPGRQSMMMSKGLSA